MVLIRLLVEVDNSRSIYGWSVRSLFVGFVYIMDKSFAKQTIYYNYPWYVNLFLIVYIYAYT